MRDLLDILAAFTALPPGESATLATVVRVEGSSYRLPGARMLIDAAGRRTGAVSGGCLEADIARRGRLLTADAPATLVRYDGADEDASWNYNLGCNGSIEVLIERIAPLGDGATDGARQGLMLLRECMAARTRAAMLTIFAAPPAARVVAGDRCWVAGEMSGVACSDDAQARPDALGDLFDAELERCLRSGETATLTFETEAGRVHALVEAVQPPLPVVIFGAGHDALPLVRQAKQLGWHVTVCDRRATYARRDRFPEADQMVVCPAEEVSQRIPLGSDTAVVVMTHHYPDDRALVHHALAAGARYVGLLGPRARADRLLEELAEAGVEFSAEQLQRLHAPVGLDLGAEGPEQVALAVTAEILAVCRRRPAAFLRDRLGPIHQPAATKVVPLPAETTAC